MLSSGVVGLLAESRRLLTVPLHAGILSYIQEYGSDFFEMQKDAIKPGQTCVVIDDLIATGGSAYGAGELIKKLGGKTLEYLFLIELTFLNGTQRLDAPSYSIVKEK